MVVALLALLGLAALLVFWAALTLADRPMPLTIPKHARWTMDGETTRLGSPSEIPADEIQPLRLPGYLD